MTGAFLSVPRLTDALPRHIHLPVCFGIMGSHSRAAKKNTSNGNEVLPQGITYLKQGPCYQQGSLCQDPTGNWTTRRPPDLLTIVKRCKLQWYGHVSCSSGLAKIILQGTVKRGRKQGRQRKRWEDNTCLLYTSPSPRDSGISRMPSSA